MSSTDQLVFYLPFLLEGAFHEHVFDRLGLPLRWVMVALVVWAFCFVSTVFRIVSEFCFPDGEGADHNFVEEVAVVVWYHLVPDAL